MLKDLVNKYTPWRHLTNSKPYVIQNNIFKHYTFFFNYYLHLFQGEIDFRLHKVQRQIFQEYSGCEKVLYCLKCLYRVESVTLGQAFSIVTWKYPLPHREGIPIFHFVACFATMWLAHGEPSSVSSQGDEWMLEPELDRKQLIT